MQKKIPNKSIDSIIKKLIHQCELSHQRPIENKCSLNKHVNPLLKIYNLKINNKIKNEYINGQMIKDDPEIMMHNINHFRVAPKFRRYNPEFGLGAPPNHELYNSATDIPMEVNQLDSINEEALVIMLDNLQALHKGYILEQLQIYNFNSLIRFKEQIKDLFSLGLIDITGVPTNSLRD